MPVRPWDPRSPARRSRARVVFGLFSVGFVIAAVFHLAALRDPAAVDGSPAWRHGLFAAINAVAAAGMIYRTRAFVAAFAVLCAQQLYSHGAALVSAWRDEGRVDWASVVVLVAMPIGLALIVRDLAGWRPPPSSPHRPAVNAKPRLEDE